jgi:uncharacterized protein (TIGR00159 family)
MFEKLFAALHVEDLLTSPLAMLDVLLLAVVIYQLLLLVRGTRSANMMIALSVLVLFHLITRPGLLSLNAFHTALGTLLGYVPIAVIVLFQRQIRQALSNLGRNPFAALLPNKEHTVLVEEVALAAASLASKRLGALIVIERDMGLRTFYETGISLDAEVSYDLLMNIFTYHSPLHDGAVVIAEGRIKAASCYLPLTMNPTLSRTYGTRHRAAFGITEESDALAVIVSEERGVISLVDGAEIVEHLDATSLQAALLEALGGAKEEPRHTHRRTAAIPAESTDA